MCRKDARCFSSSCPSSVVILHQNLWKTNLLDGREGRQTGLCNLPGRHPRASYTFAVGAGAETAGPCRGSRHSWVRCCPRAPLLQAAREGPGSIQVVSSGLPVHSDGWRHHEASKGICLFTAHLES